MRCEISKAATSDSASTSTEKCEGSADTSASWAWADEGRRQTFEQLSQRKMVPLRRPLMPPLPPLKSGFLNPGDEGLLGRSPSARAGAGALARALMSAGVLGLSDGLLQKVSDN